MGEMVKIVGNGGQKNASPEIRNFRQEGELGTSYFDIKYIAEDFENTILRHYLILNGAKTEITKDIGYESPNNEFAYRLNNLSPNTKYELQIEVTDGLETIRSSVLLVTTPNAILYGVKVMENNSNPETSCTYIEQAIDICPANQYGLNGWADKWPFNKIRIVGFRDGKVVKEIKKDNKTQYIDGTTVQSDVDVMVEIPKIYWKFSNISNGYELRISNAKNDSFYDCCAHKINGVEKDLIYIGTYLGSIQDGKLKSKSGIRPANTKDITYFRTAAQANGEGYQQMTWFTLVLLQILYLIAYKNLNSQSALGMGYTNAYSLTTTGGADKKGFCYGSIDDSIQMCFLGIEDLWGNTRMWIDGMKIDPKGDLLVNTNNKSFNDSAEGYENIAKCNISNGRIIKTNHTNKGAFFPMTFGGSDTTYYCDNGWLGYDSVGICGGYCTDKKTTGIFYIRSTYKNTNAYEDIGSRLCYL